MINKKAVYIFLSLTFGLTISLLIMARLLGLTMFKGASIVPQLLIMVAMFFPAISAVITQKFVMRRSLKELNLKFGPWRMYLKTYLVIISLFAINYTLVWLFFLPPDCTLSAFMKQYNVNTELPLPAGMIILIFTVATFTITPILNMIPSLGEEIGWRGWLLPNLEPLGQAKAAVLSGFIWGFWHTPMIFLVGFLYGQQFLVGAVLHFLMITGCGIWFAYVYFETRSTIQTAFMHSVFNANALGIWSIIFISNNKLLIGTGGIINVILFGLLGVWSLRMINKKTLSPSS